MQYDPTNVNSSHPTKVNSSHRTNLYPSLDQSKSETSNTDRSDQSPPPPPPYSWCAQEQHAGATSSIVPSVQGTRQTPWRPQENFVIVPTYVPFWKNRTITKLSRKLRVFFIISGLIGLIWSSAIVGLEMIIIIESYWTLYRSIWASGFLLSGSICMLIVACRTSYPLGDLMKMFAIILFFCLTGFVASVVNYNGSTICPLHDSDNYSCDNELVHMSKTMSLIIFAMANIHTLINLSVLNHEYKRTLLQTMTSNH